jgi:hypothetical protein
MAGVFDVEFEVARRGPRVERLGLPRSVPGAAEAPDHGVAGPAIRAAAGRIATIFGESVLTWCCHGDHLVRPAGAVPQAERPLRMERTTGFEPVPATALTCGNAGLSTIRDR